MRRIIAEINKSLIELLFIVVKPFTYIVALLFYFPYYLFSNKNPDHQPK